MMGRDRQEQLRCLFTEQGGMHQRGVRKLGNYWNPHRTSGSWGNKISMNKGSFQIPQAWSQRVVQLLDPEALFYKHLSTWWGPCVYLFRKTLIGKVHVLSWAVYWAQLRHKPNYSNTSSDSCLPMAICIGQIN